MKRFILSALLLAAGPVMAGSVPTKLVPSETKWLLHVDMEAFRTSRVGQALFQGVEPQLAQFKEQIHFDVLGALKTFKSITAFGMDYKTEGIPNGVLLIESVPQTQKAVEGFLVAQMLADTNGPVSKPQEAPFPIYTFQKEIFITPIADHLIVGKSREQVERVRLMVDGKAKGKTVPKLWTDQMPAGGFFFMVAAEGFADSPAIPPHAKVLKMAEGARIILGERTDRIFLNASLRGQNAEVTKQIQQVLEGLLALASLGQSENKQLMQIVDTAKVTNNDRTVQFHFELPLEMALKEIQNKTEEQGKKEARKEAKKAERREREREEKLEADAKGNEDKAQ